MKAIPARIIRCAIYTRKSTEHGLDLEFNSLDAQREACEAYVKSQTQEGWKVLPKHYDDPAFSGGSLDRPALQELLKDIDAGQLDVVVVYKIDRLTRSLTDFAKLVEVFDSKSISFVAVTQQFNTTTSMGRLTLNVLLSFAQFERELASERVRDKVAASRKKGKWTGGSVPLGYNVADKKLLINAVEAKTVRYIFKRYLELKCFRLLTDDLYSKGITTKKRPVRGGEISGGIRFTYGPLAYLLKNRTYLGQSVYQDVWFRGEHEAILDQDIFDEVQALLKQNSIKRHVKRTNGDAILRGYLFDDRGNRMSPSFSTKKGVRYRFYVSSALLGGMSGNAGSLPRVSAALIESKVVGALRSRFADQVPKSDRALIEECVESTILSKGMLRISLRDETTHPQRSPIEIPWEAPCGSRTRIEGVSEPDTGKQQQVLIQAIVRAHHWIQLLETGKYISVDALAASVELHPKVIREMLRFAFLAPDITTAILENAQPRFINLGSLKKSIELFWNAQRSALGLSERKNGAH